MRLVLVWVLGQLVLQTSFHIYIIIYYLWDKITIFILLEFLNLIETYYSTGYHQIKLSFLTCAVPDKFVLSSRKQDLKVHKRRI